MSSENVELVRRFTQAFNERDMDALHGLIGPDFEWTPYLAALIETTVYRGHDGVQRYFDDADAAWESIQVRLDELREIDDRIVVFGELHGQGRASRLEVDVSLAWIAESRAGKLVRLETYSTKGAALEAAGLRG
jgi:ketosteroid isomerase-like protein